MATHHSPPEQKKSFHAFDSASPLWSINVQRKLQKETACRFDPYRSPLSLSWLISIFIGAATAFNGSQRRGLFVSKSGRLPSTAAAQHDGRDYFTLNQTSIPPASGRIFLGKAATLSLFLVWESWKSYKSAGNSARPGDAFFIFQWAASFKPDAIGSNWTFSRPAQTNSGAESIHFIFDERRGAFMINTTQKMLRGRLLLTVCACQPVPLLATLNTFRPYPTQMDFFLDKIIFKTNK
jgi:hypothetical protein